MLSSNSLTVSSITPPVMDSADALTLPRFTVAEAGYFAANDPPEGEIWIRGPSVTKGYFQRDDLTAETIKDGWLNTGDIGRANKVCGRETGKPGPTLPCADPFPPFSQDGTISVIDRKKNLVKLSGGEYIALERLE